MRGRRCAVGWNESFHGWDLKLRRGTLGTAILEMVVEHHGGPKRLARFRTKISPPRLFYWVFSIVAVLVAGTYALGFPVAAVVLVSGLAGLWATVAAEAGRLESVIMAQSYGVAESLQKEAIAKELAAVKAVFSETPMAAVEAPKCKSASASASKNGA